MSSFMSKLGFSCAMPGDRSGLCAGVRTKGVFPAEVSPRGPMHLHADMDALWKELQHHGIESASYKSQNSREPLYDIRVQERQPPQYAPSSRPRTLNIHHRAARLSMDGNYELPNDFCARIAALIAKDDGVQQRILNEREVAFCSTYSLPSRFLQKCLGQQEPEARKLWKAVDVQSRQDLLLTYECGPPSPQFFADMMMQEGIPDSD